MFKIQTIAFTLGLGLAVLAPSLKASDLHIVISSNSDDSDVAFPPLLVEMEKEGKPLQVDMLYVAYSGTNNHVEETVTEEHTEWGYHCSSTSNQGTRTIRYFGDTAEANPELLAKLSTLEVGKEFLIPDHDIVLKAHPTHIVRTNIECRMGRPVEFLTREVPDGVTMNEEGGPIPCKTYTMGPLTVYSIPVTKEHTLVGQMVRLDGSENEDEVFRVKYVGTEKVEEEVPVVVEIEGGKLLMGGLSQVRAVSDAASQVVEKKKKLRYRSGRKKI